MNTDVLDRIKKLLRLAGNNPSAEEAQAAAAKAQELMDAHKIDSRTVSIEEEPEAVKGIWHHDPIDSMRRVTRWKQQLIAALADMNACQLINCRDRTMGEVQFRLIGTSTNVEQARFLYQWIWPQIDRLARQEHIAVLGRAFGISYRVGLVEGVHARLYLQRQDALDRARAAGATTTALAVFDQEKAALQDYIAGMDKEGMRTRSVKPPSDGLARKLGHRDADKVGINRPLEAARDRQLPERSEG